MKKFLALGTLFLALQAHSQSYLILNNGVALTTDKEAYVYDFGHFILPYKVTLVGGQYLAENDKLITIDENGFLYRKDEKVSRKVKGKGINYFISDTGTLYTFDTAGFYYKFNRDPIMKKAYKFGGTFFTVRPDENSDQLEIVTVNSKGNYLRSKLPGLTTTEITYHGGNYFMTRKGIIHTISKDGEVIPKADVKTGYIRKEGGNFFVDSKGILWTVSEEGFLFKPILPTGHKVSTITQAGVNYYLNNEGKIFVVDKSGEVYERFTGNHDVRNAKILAR